MLDKKACTEHLPEIKRHLKVTWSDSDTDSKIIDDMMDTELDLNHLLGSEIDFFAPGPDRALYREAMLYKWNNCYEEFQNAYRAEILARRHYYEVKNHA